MAFPDDSQLSRRSLLGFGAAGMVSLLAGSGDLARVAAPADVGPEPPVRLPRFRPLADVADANGFLLPPGFTSRVVARSGEVVEGTTYVFPDVPDGAGCIGAPDGGWWLVWNSEVDRGGGGASSLRFGRDGSLVSAQQVLSGASRPCAGGVTPWGTWLAAEETDRGYVWDVDPSGVNPAVRRPAMGRFVHEAAAVDGARRIVYLSEDHPAGFFYRFRYGATSGLTSGVLEAAKLSAGGAVSWLAVPDPSAATVQCRQQVAATPFNGGEGLCIMDGRRVFLTTKGDDRVWRYDPVTDTMTVLYQPGTGTVLSGVDNIAVSPGHDLLVCEDGGNMELVAIELDGRATPLLRLTGQPTSELTGVCLSPDGRHLYLASQRAISATKGIVYEITGPFPW